MDAEPLAIVTYWGISVDRLPHLNRSRSEQTRVDCGEIFKPEPAGVDRHANGAMYVHTGQSLNVIESGNAASSNQFVFRTAAQFFEPKQVCALHHAFLVYVGAQKAGAVGLELLDHVYSAPAGCLLPAFYHDVTIVAIKRNRDRGGADL